MGAKRRDRQAKFGQVRPPIHVNFQGHKFVVAGNEIHFDREERIRTFPDFLMRYMPTVLNREWGQREIHKVFGDRHQILKFYDALCRCQRRSPRGEDGLISGVPDGPTLAYFQLAYDLYVVKDNASLQSKVLRRLRDPQTFQAARHELLTASIGVRTGFEIKYEDDKLPGRHAEFIGTHRASSQQVAFEAKTRHRPGVLGYPGSYSSETRAGVDSLLRDAFDKADRVDLPFAIFVDVNLDPSADDEWKQEVQETVARLCADRQYDPFNVLVFTNVPNHYGREGESAPRKDVVWAVSDKARAPLDLSIALSITDEAVKWGAIPNSFDE
jgi:hypothetical protein